VVTTALVIAVIVAVIELRRRWASPALLFGACFVAAVLATRLYLLAHYPTDLIAGGVLGVSWALGTIWLWKRCSAVNERA
jgi:undecaprenyl-diphosphatase